MGKPLITFLKIVKTLLDSHLLPPPFSPFLPSSLSLPLPLLPSLIPSFPSFSTYPILWGFKHPHGMF